MARKSAAEARNQFSNLLDAAERGKSTVITRQGWPVAALVPFEDYEAAVRQESLLPVAGTGRGLWGRHSGTTLRKVHDEWSR